MDVREKLVEIVKKAAYSSLPSNTEDFHLNMFVMNLLAHGVTVQEWISVDDRFPEPFESVLVFRDGKITIDHHEENGWFAYDFNRKRATHWMPIPKPPKGE